MALSTREVGLLETPNRLKTKRATTTFRTLGIVLASSILGVKDCYRTIKRSELESLGKHVCGLHRVFTGDFEGDANPVIFTLAPEFTILKDRGARVDLSCLFHGD
jgi:hypothetical protein